MRLPARVLEPSERIAEILFGLIMALTVTGATSVVTADRFQIRTMLIAALGCNVAWGIIDAGMYLMARLIEQGSNALLLREIREAPDNQTAHRVIADALPPLLAAIFQPAQLELIREGFRRVPDSELRPTGWARKAFASLLFSPLFQSRFPLSSLKTRNWRYESPTPSPSHCYFFADSFLRVMQGFGHGQWALQW
jgi:hypothetical protein